MTFGSSKIGVARAIDSLGGGIHLSKSDSPMGIIAQAGTMKNAR
jgi:hypothetical protein